MKPYLVVYNFYYDGELINCYSSTQLLETPCNEEFFGTDFEGLWDLQQKWASIIPLNAGESKKGKKYLQFYNKFSHVTKNNCKPWRLTITNCETSVSMESLMKFNSEDVIRYFKERGMNNCPITNI